MKAVRGKQNTVASVGTQVVFIGILIGNALLSSEAMAGGRREGFNFGTSVRVLTGDDRTYARDDEGSGGSDKNTQIKSSSQSVNPFLGYSFGYFNIGLMATAESRSSQSVETSATSDQQITRESDTALKGASLFTRFLFGEVMFMEVGFGLYDESVKVNNTYTSAAGDGIFTGERETYEVHGSGPGYHMGGGIELPMGGDFYFTSAYMVRLIQLRETTGGVFGRKKAYEQKRELTFGVAHYIN